MSENVIYHNYYASFRIFGGKVNFEEISNMLGIKPTHTHRKGEEANKISKRTYPDDMWMLDAAVSEETDLEKHLLWLKKKLLPHKKYILRLKKKNTVDIYCSYRSDSDQGGFSLSPKSLELFVELDILFEFSIIIA